MLFLILNFDAIYKAIDLAFSQDIQILIDHCDIKKR